MSVSVNRGRVAVVYFSWSPEGGTRQAAKAIAGALSADLFEIVPQTAYNRDYRKCCDEANPECYGKQLRPIRPMEGWDPARYDAVFVGTPNWWGTMAPPVRTWVTQNAEALKGKTLCLFQTNGGGGMQRCEREFAELLPGVNLLPAKAVSGASVHRELPAFEKFAKENVTIQ